MKGMKKVLCQKWVSLWTKDGSDKNKHALTLHLSLEDLNSYIKEHTYKYAYKIFPEYFEPAGEAIFVEVDNALFERIKATKNGMVMVFKNSRIQL